MKYIARNHERNTFEKHVNAPLFRKTFIYKKSGATAKIKIVGLGFYQLYLNGENITKGILAPYISNTDHYVYYDEYDVSDKLLDGPNAIGIVLGNGMQNAIGGEVWEYDKASFCSEVKTALEFSVDGKVVFGSDENFKTHASAITFDDLRAGVHYDARLETDGWALPDFDDSDWDNAIETTAPLGQLRLCNAHAIVKEKEIKPVAIIKSNTGYIYDFGENNSGVCRLKIVGQRGQKIVMTHGEMIIDGELSIENISCKGHPPRLGYLQTDEYVCRGNGVEVWTPDFTYHGFRYVGVWGITEEQATTDLLTFIVYHSELKEIGYFNCDNPVVNKIWEITRRTDKANFYYFPTDCPQREKNGWTGDAALSAERMVLNFDVLNDYSEWLANIRKAQRPTGQLPCIIPSDKWGFVWKNNPLGCGPGWERIIVELPYLLYKYNGDTKVLYENADAIRKYIGFMERSFNDDGLADYGIGDWTEVNTFSESRHTTPATLTSTLICMDTCVKASSIFSVIGCHDDAGHCLDLRNITKNAFRRAYLSVDCSLTCKTQTAQAMALYYGAFEPQEEQAAFKNLLDYIARDNNHFKIGMLGARVLFRVLTKYGRSDLALKLITQESNPSYGYLLKKGATTLWEVFNLLEEGDSMLRADGGKLLSLNHPAWGDVSAWFCETFGGINVERADLINVRPDFTTEIKAAEAYFSDKFGSIKVKWKKKSNKIELNVTLGEDMKCTIFDDVKQYNKGSYNFTFND